MANATTSIGRRLIRMMPRTRDSLRAPGGRIGSRIRRFGAAAESPIRPIIAIIMFTMKARPCESAFSPTSVFFKMDSSAARSLTTSDALSAMSDFWQLRTFSAPEPSSASAAPHPAEVSRPAFPSCLYHQYKPRPVSSGSAGSIFFPAAPAQFRQGYTWDRGARAAKPEPQHKPWQLWVSELHRRGSSGGPREIITPIFADHL